MTSYPSQMPRGLVFESWMIRNRARNGWLGFGLCLCLLVVGCESKPYRLAPVNGKITLDGKPVPGAFVKFTPLPVEGKTPGPVSKGRCDTEGRYSLTTIDGDAGAIVGKHRVSIYSYSAPEILEPGEAPGKEMFPRRFNTASKLISEVTESGLENENFELTTRRR